MLAESLRGTGLKRVFTRVIEENTAPALLQGLDTMHNRKMNT